MSELQFPDIVGQFQQGQDRGRALLATRLAGQAFSAPADQRQSALSQLAGVNPNDAIAMQSNFRAQDAATAAAAKTQEVDHAKKINGAANFMLQAVQTKDPARIQGAYQAVKPYLAELGASQGMTPPDQFTPDMLPHLYQIVGQTGGQTEQKLTVVGQGSTALGPDGSVAFSNPAAPANGQLVDIPDGQGGTVKMLFDPKTRQLSQPNYGGGQGQPTQPAVDPMQPYIDQANQAVKLGADPAKVDAWLAQQAQAGGLQPQGAGASPAQPQGLDTAMPMPGQAPAHGLGYAPPKATPQVRPLTADELKQYGLPEGTAAQVDQNGKVSVINKPPQLSPDKMADVAAKRQKAQAAQQEAVSSIDDSIGQIDTLLKSPGFNNIGTFMGDTIGRIPHTGTADARAQLDTVGNQSLLTTLGNMKSLSATGASGFGALSDSEGKILRNAAANLTESQSNEALRQHLMDYRAKLLRTRQHIASTQVSLPEDSVGQQAPQQPASGGWAIQRVN